MAAFLIVAALLLLRFPFIYSNSGVQHVPHLYSTPPVVFRKNVQWPLSQISRSRYYWGKLEWLGYQRKNVSWWYVKPFRYNTRRLCVFGGHGLCVFGGFCVDMWRLVHQRSFLLFDCFWRLVHCWYSLGRRVTIGTPMVIFAVLTVFWLYQQCINRQKQSKHS